MAAAEEGDMWRLAAPSSEEKLAYGFVTLDC
jgi:hypothetical protein